MSENRLHHETSPYLLQHKDNPVHWRAWSKAALDEAKASGKPILLSVGYAACHWCHVMAHESFEDQETADVMNELFVNIKVDREERPDIDAIYMGALHQLGQRGGWPLTMFLDAEGRPFWGGTYFPKTPKYGQPAFQDVLRQVADIYTKQPDKVAHNAKALTDALAASRSESGPEFNDTMIEDLTGRMVRAVDPDLGGINGAPKFPQWNFFWLLWRGAIRYRQPDARKAVETTLHMICQGGIYDHLAGGFSRYAVDEYWLVPHFEKMLYDNALLIDLMTEVWRETQSPLLKQRVHETIVWVLSEMVAEGGGFAASLDADSEGEEGKFYVWSSDEIRACLGDDDAQYFSSWYDVTDTGNWEGKTILNRLRRLSVASDENEARLKELRDKLLAHRTSRIRPGWDDKVLADWNGLMIAALARSARVFNQPTWLAAAEAAFAFVCNRMVCDGRLHHAFRDGKTSAPATASDYANMIWAALRLHEATLQSDYLDQAEAWTQRLNRNYWLGDSGGYAMTADDTDDVIVRLKMAADDATPNANAVMLSNLMRLFLITGDAAYEARATDLCAAFAADVAANLVAHSGFVAACLDQIAPQQSVITSPATASNDVLPDLLNTVSLPGAFEYRVDNHANSDLPVGLSDKSPRTDQETAYCCVGPQCAPPTTEGDEFLRLLKQTRSV
ncbi:MAG: thioredoxin domain-containing protein [Alphaproteobacteria bacterium]|nr:thioredoxin domain-containing protein [Alphaproteobacteria bacterium]